MARYSDLRRLGCIAIAIASAVSGCNAQLQEPSPNEWASRIFREAQVSTVPSTAVDVAQSRPTAGSQSLAMSWEFDVQSDGTTYRTWVLSMLGSEFQPIRADPSHLTFVRYLDGDSEGVEIDIEPSEQSKHVRVSVNVYPD